MLRGFESRPIQHFMAVYDNWNFNSILVFASPSSLSRSRTDHVTCRLHPSFPLAISIVLLITVGSLLISETVRAPHRAGQFVRGIFCILNQQRGRGIKEKTKRFIWGAFFWLVKNYGPRAPSALRNDLSPFRKKGLSPFRLETEMALNHMQTNRLPWSFKKKRKCLPKYWIFLPDLLGDQIAAALRYGSGTVVAASLSSEFLIFFNLQLLAGLR